MFETEPYFQSLTQTPQTGRHLIAYQAGELMLVYQAYKPSIADYAVKHQHFGGPEFGYGRMSWIKPSFLWMMFRCGWAQKENQERVLAISIEIAAFKALLHQAILSHFVDPLHGTMEAWQTSLAESPVRMQWDPDHDPIGNRRERRAIQIGLKGEALEQYGKHLIRGIEDVTDFVTQQHRALQTQGLAALIVPQERLLAVEHDLQAKIGADAAHRPG